MPAALISLVVATYNVEAYLPAFLNSLDAQTNNLTDVEIIFVDDGSTDHSAELIESWIDAGHADTRLVSKSNGGSASARNAGLDQASGKWVSFPDPDDELSPNYVATVATLLTSDSARRVHLVSTNLLMLDDATGEITDTHELRAKFTEGAQTFDLERHPHLIQLSAASAFFRRAVIEDRRLRFDPAIRPNFEDASFTALYLACFPRPRMAVQPTAHYLYRRRRDASSQIQSSWTKPEKYTTVLENGYLALFQTLDKQLGRVPMWAQNMVIYDLAFFLRVDARVGAPTDGLSADVRARFHDLLRQILGYIESETIDAFRINWMSDEMRAVLIIGGKGDRDRPDYVHLDHIDPAQRLVRLRYYFAGRLPAETYRARGFIVEPVHSKIRAVSFIGKTMMYQRIAWLPATGFLSVDLDGHRVPLRIGSQGTRPYSADPSSIWRVLAQQQVPRNLYGHPSPKPRTVRSRLGVWKRYALSRLPSQRRSRSYDEIGHKLADSAIRVSSRMPFVRRRYRNAWLLLDRDDLAQDNAERLYRYLRAEQPHVNAWSVEARQRRLGPVAARPVQAHPTPVKPAHSRAAQCATRRIVSSKSIC